ncbi:MAG: hypothetical protein LPK08_15040 [Halomonas sp.]|mgnify:CR=1 FL=1|nr:hypothetical protein [Halomonas sulfidivorans]MDX5378819.1 hypothetical protein [Halomonas sp.]
MRNQKPNRSMDEREKLRKFRELDDAFAQALRELEKPDSRLDIPTGPPVRSLAELEAEEQEQRQQAFEARLQSLMKEYAQPRESVADLLRTLRTLGHIA